MQNSLRAVRVLVFAALACAAAGRAQTTTPNVGLNRIPSGYQNWGPLYNADQVKIDTVLGQLQESYQGAWSNTGTYAKGQIVTYQGALYQSQLAPNTGNNPATSTSQWVLVLNVTDSLGLTPENVANKGAANGYAPLDSGSKVPIANLPSLPESQITNLISDLITASTAAPALSIDPCSAYGVWPVSFTALACDGTTDDSTALQNLFNSVVASSTPVDIALPVRTVKLTKQIVINNPTSAIRIHGEGYGSVLNWTAEDANGSGLVVENSTVPVEIRGVNLMGTTYDALKVMYVTGGFTLSKSYISGGAQGSTISGVPPAGVYVQGGNHLRFAGNTFTGNGPQTGSTSCTNASNTAVICPQGYTFVTGYQYFAGNLTTSLTKDLQFSDNKVYGNNNLIATAFFNLNQSEIGPNNFVDQNNAFLNDSTADAELAQGYAYLTYGNAHVSQAMSNFSSMARSSNVVTVTMTSGLTVPYVVGQWICVNAGSLGATNSSQFSGCFPVASVSGSGGSTPTFTYSQFGPTDTESGTVDMVNALQGNTIQANVAQNAASSCIYAQTQIDSTITGNKGFGCAQMMDSFSVPIGGVICTQCYRTSISDNVMNTMVSINPNQIGGQSYLAQCIGIYNADESSVVSNHCFDYSQAGVLVGTGADGVTVSDNGLDGAQVGSYGIYIPNSTPWNRVITNHNTVKQVITAAINYGNAPTGFGFGGVIAGNAITGNTSAAPMTYGIFSQTGSQQNIYGNECYGLVNGNNSGRTLNTCIYVTAGSHNLIHGNVANACSNSQYCFVDSGTGNEWYGNMANNSVVIMNAASSTNIRVHDNRFDLSGTAQTFGAWPASAERWNNKLTTTGSQRGTCTLVAGTCSASTTEIQTGDIVQLSRTTLGGTPGELSYGTITAGTSFVITSSASTDTSTVYWTIVH